MTTEQMAEQINQGPYGFRIERPGAGWESPWVAIDKQTSHASPMTDRDVLVKYEQLGLHISDAARTLGRKGGSVASEAQKAAARRNAKKGGWPKGRPRKVRHFSCPDCGKIIYTQQVHTGGHILRDKDTGNLHDCKSQKSPE